MPTTNEDESTIQDKFETISYWYDLEIDQNGLIVGGEWQDIIHPDFIWVVAKNYVPKSFYDYVIEDGLMFYDGKTALSKNISTQAKLAGKKGEILFTIIEAMNRLSQDL